MTDSRQEDFLRKAFQHQEGLEVYAFGFLQDWSLAKDAVQEAYIKAGTNWESIRSESTLAWMRKVTYRKSIDILRSRKRHVGFDDETLELLHGHFERHTTIEAIEEKKMRDNALRKCMHQLDQRSVLLLNDFYDKKKSCLVLGEEMQKTANSVRILLTRLRKRLRKCVELRLEETIVNE
ncbi:hypothetical protein BVY04_03380 [bacterium M21]|nr:hypothetical protein BVY04_03380 [bacterium M21]